MPDRVYEVRDEDRERLAADLAEDRISRLSLAVREARHFGVDRDTVFVVLRGEEPVLALADERILVYARLPEDAERVLAWVQWEDDASAVAVGSVFGPVGDVVPPPRPPPPPAWKRFWEWLKT